MQICSSRFSLETENLQVLHNAIVKTVLSVDIEKQQDGKATNCVKILTSFCLTPFSPKGYNVFPV